MPVKPLKRLHQRIRWICAALLAGVLDCSGPMQAQTPDAFNPGAYGEVFSMAVQPDGKILVGGDFETLGGQTRNRIARLNADGTLDASFNPSASRSVYCLALQTDGKILTGGAFAALGGQARYSIGRLLPDGTLDSDFNPGANDYVYSLLTQADDKILVIGWFTMLGGEMRNGIGRLHADGTLDTGFNPGAATAVTSVALQSDGKIVAGGGFTLTNGQSRNYIGRLYPDGTLDPAFNPDPNGGVLSIAVQPDGKIVVGGTFTILGGQPRNLIGRLNADGTLDTTFNPGAAGYSYAAVKSLAVQADGKILVGGSFTNLGGQARYYIGRVHADGMLDTGFNPGANYYVHSLAVQADGKVLVGGNFNQLGGEFRGRIGRLNNTDPAAQSLTYDGSTIAWKRGGASPELSRVSFDVLTNSAVWTGLGTATRISGGWELNGVLLPTNAVLRALGFATGGAANGSSWFLETIIGSPYITVQPSSRTNNAGTVASFGITAFGAQPLRYQWCKNSVDLNEGGNISGAHSPSLVLSNVFGGDAGGYSVIVSNISGSVTSEVAVLHVVDPTISSQPVSRTANAGNHVTFSVIANGTEPLSYQWRRGAMSLLDFENVSGTHTPVLTLTNVLRGDEGEYSVLVTNIHGSVMSVAATLTVEKDPFISSEPISQSANRGQTVVFRAVAAGTAPLVYHWRRAGTTLVSTVTASLTLTNVQSADAGGYDVVVSNVYDSVTSVLATLTINLATPDSFNPTANGSVNALVVQADGRVLVGGSFTRLAGGNCTNLGRIYSDGTLDITFNLSASGPVYSLATHPDGRILVGGGFNSLGGQARNFIGRINSDGTLDTDFNPGANNLVSSFVVQPDGSIVVGGAFQTLDGQIRNRIGRLHADGSLDTAFALGANNQVYSLAPQADGKLLVGGRFTSLGGQARSRIGRYNADGTLDTNFNPGSSGFVYSLAVQADDKILVGGNLSGGLRRLSSDGMSDTNFNPGADGIVYSLSVQADGKILLGGDFTSVGGQARQRIARINDNGTLDPTFNPGANGDVYSVGMQADGRILVGGNFTALGGQTRNRAGRLSNPEPASQSLNFNTSSITWLRGGGSPEVWRATFDYSTNRVDWTALGSGNRIDGGWERTGLFLTPNTIVRARGFGAGGYLNGSGWFVQSWGGVPLPRLNAISFGTNEFRFTFESVPGMNYMIEQRNSFTVDDWTTLEKRSASTELETVVDPSAVGNMRFYRVRPVPFP